MSEDTMRQNMIALAQTYASAKGLAMTTVSKQIHGRDDFLAKYLAGEMSPTVRTYFRMVDRLREAMPKGTKWPETRNVGHIPRVPYAPKTMPPRESGTGKFLGKKVPKRGSRT